MPRLTDSFVRGLLPPLVGNRITYDDVIKGFGIRITGHGSRAFILNYRNRSGRERRLTIGSFPDWGVSAARQEAAELKRRIDRGNDPLEEADADRNAKTVADLVRRFEAEHLPRKRSSTQKSYRSIIASEILPALKHLKVTEVGFADMDRLHRGITARGAPYRANRTIACLSKIFSLSVLWGWRPDNPVRGIERNDEKRRHRYLKANEVAALSKALERAPDQQAADMIRLLLLTGARCGEVRAAKWEDIDLDRGIWTKPGATTKQRTDHRVPLSASARELLHHLRDDATDKAGFVFPDAKGNARGAINHQWKRICAEAGVADARLHDLRHTYASILASSGLSLPIIGALLGHTQPATTARYAHLFDDPLREAAESVGTVIRAMSGMSE